MDINLSNDENYITLIEKNQHKILGRVERDALSLRLSGAVKIQNPDGRLSDTVTIRRSKLITTGEKELLWIFDSSGNFDLDDLKRVKEKLLELLQKPSGEIIETADQATEEEVYEELIIYIKKKDSVRISPDGKIIIDPTVFIEGGTGWIRTKEFEKFVKENKSLGWNDRDILKMLKRNNLLYIGNGRTFDKKKKVNGVANNYYAIKMQELITDDEIEEINIKLVRDKDAD